MEPEAVALAAMKMARDSQLATTAIIETMLAMVDSVLTQQALVSAKMDAVVALVSKQDVKAAYWRARDGFKASSPKLFNPLDWGDQPEWLAQFLLPKVP